MKPASFALAALTTAVLCSCAVGPDFKRPEPPKVTGYSAAPLPVQTGTDAQKVVSGQDIPAQWWTLFRSPALDELIQQSLESNPTLQSAQASLRQANENVAAQKGSLFPQAQAEYDFTRNRDAIGTLQPALNSGAAIYSLHTAQVSVSYLFDIFGLNRRQVESAQAQADSQRYQLEAAWLTLTANVVNAAIQEASLRAQIAATRDMVNSGHESGSILRRQFGLGAVAETDVMAVESAVANLEATLPPLQKQLAQQRHLLTALAGRFPSDEPTQQFELSDLTLPLEIPLSLPSALVRQRPDVLQAEADLHAASAHVGVATANLFPQISLTANAGGTSTSFNQMFKNGNSFWSMGGSLSQTLFQGGTLIHQRRAAVAALDAAGAQYRAVVLAAFQEVADALTALQVDADAVTANEKAERAAGDSLKAIRHNVEIGLSSYLALLNAQQAYSQAVLNLAQARANRYSDTAALLQALGGGWWNRDSSVRERQLPQNAH